MKKIKLLLALLVVTFILSTIDLSALETSWAYTGVSLPSLRGYQTLEAKYKYDGTYDQEFYNTGNINSCTGNENGIRVKLYYFGNYSSEITISNGNSSGTWGSEPATHYANSYTPYVRNNTYSVCSSSFSGVWYHY